MGEDHGYATVEDRLRTLYGARDLLFALAKSQWQKPDAGPFYLGLEMIARSIDTATNALDNALPEEVRRQACKNMQDTPGGEHEHD